MCCITIKSDGRNMDLNPLTALTSLHTLTVTGHIESLEPVGVSDKHLGKLKACKFVICNRRMLKDLFLLL